MPKLGWWSLKCCWSLLYSAILCSWALTVVACDSTWVTSFLYCFKKKISTEVVYLQHWYGWCHMKLLLSRCVLRTPYIYAPCHFMQSHILKVHTYLAVTCTFGWVTGKWNAPELDVTVSAMFVPKLRWDSLPKHCSLICPLCHMLMLWVLFLRFIQDWVFHGTFRDVYGEFMIQMNPTFLEARGRSGYFRLAWGLLVGNQHAPCLPQSHPHPQNKQTNKQTNNNNNNNNKTNLKPEWLLVLWNKIQTFFRGRYTKTT